MARGLVVVVLKNAICDCGKVGPCLAAEPVERANIFLERFVEGLAFVRR